MGLSYDPNFTVRRSIKCDNKQIKVIVYKSSNLNY